MPTVRQWFDQWLDAKSGANAELTLTKYRQAADDFLAFLGARADGRLDSVGQHDAITFRDGMRKDGKSATTRNQIIAKIVATPFRAAFKQSLTLVYGAMPIDIDHFTPSSPERAPLDSFHMEPEPPFVGQLLSEESLRRTGYFDIESVRHWRNAFRKMRAGSLPGSRWKWG